MGGIIAPLFGMYKKIKRYFSKNREITQNVIFALSIYLIFEILGYLGLVQTFPVGIWQKLVFAILVVGITISISLKYLQGFFPRLRELVDRNNIEEFRKLPSWLKYSLGFGVFALFFWGIIYIVGNL